MSVNEVVVFWAKRKFERSISICLELEMNFEGFVYLLVISHYVWIFQKRCCVSQENDILNDEMRGFFPSHVVQENQPLSKARQIWSKRTR